MKQFIRFACIGGLGFVVDAAVLLGLIQYYRVDPYFARVASFFVAATFTWSLNRRFTFKMKSSQSSLKEWATYTTLMMLGGGVNVGVYTFVVYLFGSEPWTLLAGLAGGTVSGLVVNFVTAKRLFIGKRQHP